MKRSLQSWFWNDYNSVILGFRVHGHEFSNEKGLDIGINFLIIEEKIKA
jgi:hypothetical protein